MSSESQNSNPLNVPTKVGNAGVQVPDGHSVTKRLQSELMQLMVSWVFCGGGCNCKC
jgi:hypothetical protein